MVERGERNKRDSSERRGRPKFFKKKSCKFCAEKIKSMTYKETDKIAKFLTEKGKMIPRRISGNCAKHQRMLARAIKISRHACIVPFQVD